MQFRTDLALEAVGNEDGFSQTDHLRHTQQKNGVTVTTQHILSDKASKRWGKPKGKYVTLELPPLTDNEKLLLEAAAVVAHTLSSLLPKTGMVLTVGLGNRAITPDALGPKTADMVLATRHIQGEFAKSVGLADLRPSAVLSPGVLGQTGAESGEIVNGLCRMIRPAAVIAVDALAALSVTRLGCTVQLTDTGISPGAGVGNHRHPLNRETLGVPVIGIGVPTVVDAAVIAAECGNSELTQNTGFVVTPREIDLLVSRAARLVAAGINLALQPEYPPLELISLALG